MENIEVEIRSFIDKQKYEELLAFFSKNAKLVKEDSQETHYFNSKEDVRIQKNNNYSKIYFKKGKIHDECREEHQIKVERDDFEKLEKLFEALGNSVKIKWFRTRHEFEWNGIKVDVDYTKGYGYILELEKITSEDKKEEALTELKEKLSELGIEHTPREIFEEKFKLYEENWQNLIAEAENLSLT